MYARTITDSNTESEEVLTFGVSGKLIMNVLVMFDRQTNSLWSQILGEAVEGTYKGYTLEPLASLQTTWGRWKELHPDTKALETGGRGSRDPYTGYYANDAPGVLDETRKDTRLPRKSLVTGIVIDGQPAAYSRMIQREELVINDVVNDVPILVVFDPQTATSLVFNRVVEGQILTFRPHSDELEFIDNETNSVWSVLTGTASSGALAGQKLERIPSTSSFWFGWKDWYPQTLVYGR